MSNLPSLFEDWEERPRTTTDLQRICQNRKALSKRIQSELRRHEGEAESDIDHMGKRKRTNTEENSSRDETDRIQDETLKMKYKMKLKEIYDNLDKTGYKVPCIDDISSDIEDDCTS